MADVVYIRDSIVIDAEFMAFLYQQPLAPGSTLFLVAREIVHATGYVLSLPSVNVVAVGDVYDANGGRIVVSGLPGSSRSATAGGPGSAGGSVQLICFEISGVHAIADGGAGGVGATGGVPAVHQADADASSTSADRAGGDGGPGGAGGRVEVIFVTSAVAPVLRAAGGRGGRGGVSEGADYGNRGRGAGKSGRDAPTGRDGHVSAVAVPVDEYFDHVRGVLGSAPFTPVASHGSILQQVIEHRMAVGQYHYRRYYPGVSDPDRATAIQLAQDEFDTVMKLDPQNADAPRLKRQIVENLNILGLPWQMDVIPDFTTYEDKFTKWGNLVFGEVHQGIEDLVASTEIATTTQQILLQIEQFTNEIADVGADLKQAIFNRDVAVQGEVTDAQSRVDAIQHQISAALNEMAQHDITIDTIVDTVASVATAAVAIAAAVSTGGASLVALVPEIVSLAQDVTSNAGPLVSEVFGQTQPDIDRVTAEYTKVKGDVSDVISDANKIINLVNAVQQLATGITSDNAQYVSLVQQGVEAAHALAIAQLHHKQADLAVQALQAKQQRAKSLLDDAQALENQTEDNIQALRAGGLTAIRRAQSAIEGQLLFFAFLMERSFEIYTLQPANGKVLFDAGFIHPDDEKSFVENPNADPGRFITEYQNAFASLLKPVEMSGEITHFFTPAQGGPRRDVLRLSFKDPGILADFKSRHHLAFSMSLVDDVPGDHPEAKELVTAVSFIAATSTSGAISCEVGHGPRYDSKRRNGDGVQQILQRRTTPVLASTTPLQPPAFTFDPGEITQPHDTNPLFGRGVAGPWEVSISEDEIRRSQVILTNLTEIQIWIGYVFMAVSG